MNSTLEIVSVIIGAGALLVSAVVLAIVTLRNGNISGFDERIASQIDDLHRRQGAHLEQAFERMAESNKSLIKLTATLVQLLAENTELKTIDEANELLQDIVDGEA